MSIENVGRVPMERHDATREITALISACDEARERGISAVRAGRPGNADFQLQNAIGARLTRGAEAVAQMHEGVGVDVRPERLVSQTPDEFRGHVKNRSFLYWSDPSPDELPGLVEEYHRIAPTRREQPERRSVRIAPTDSLGDHLDRKPESDVGNPFIRPGVEFVAKASLVAYGLPPDVATAAVWAAGRMVAGPKTTVEKVIGIGIAIAPMLDRP